MRENSNHRDVETFSKIIIRSGGQTGVDRAALDWAISENIQYEGWVPLGGWAEDYPNPPGVLSEYGKLKATPKLEPNQRTEWNVRDAALTLVLIQAESEILLPGTKHTISTAENLGREIIIVNMHEDNADIMSAKVRSLFERGESVNIAGPRESESPGIYELSRKWLRENFTRML